MNTIEKLCNELNNFIQTNDLQIKENYHLLAEKFQLIIQKLLIEITQYLKNELFMQINEIPILANGSVLKGSTAMGFIIEEIYTRIIKSSNIANQFIFPEETIDSAYDIKFNNDKVDLLCNLKVEKHGEIYLKKNNNKLSQNNGIVAGKILQSEYALNIENPKLYLVSKIPYIIDLDNSKLLLQQNKITSIYLESFIWDGIKSDHRNWSKEFNPLSGRLQMPTKTKIGNYSISTIPSYSEIKTLIEQLAQSL